jgi:hypothetical protein
MTSEMKQQEMEWRRSKVLELSSQGYSEREISEVIKVNDTAVHRDLAYLRKQAHENIQQHIHETVPEEYQKCMVGMKRTLRHVLEIENAIQSILVTSLIILLSLSWVLRLYCIDGKDIIIPLFIIEAFTDGIAALVQTCPELSAHNPLSPVSNPYTKYFISVLYRIL